VRSTRTFRRFDATVTLIHADWREVELVGDVLITDPPYGTENETGYGRKQNYGGAGRKIENDATTEEMFELLERAPQDRAAVFCSPRNQQEVWGGIADAGWRLTAWLIWDKTVPGLGAPIQYQHELIGLLTRSGKSIDTSIISVLSYYPESRKRPRENHPHQKPLALLQRLTKLYDVKSMVDPFMGSGTTPLACLLQNINCIGIEKDETYFKMACDRLEAECAQGVLF